MVNSLLKVFGWVSKVFLNTADRQKSFINTNQHNMPLIIYLSPLNLVVVSS